MKFHSVEQVHYPIIEFETTCSKGTYIRSLVRDIGKKLGYPAYARDLTRLSIGRYSLSNALNENELTLNKIKDNVFKRYEEAFSNSQLTR